MAHKSKVKKELSDHDMEEEQQEHSLSSDDSEQEEADDDEEDEEENYKEYEKDGFVVSDSDEEIQRQKKKKNLKKKKEVVEEELDEDDIALIQENQQEIIKKKRLVKLNDVRKDSESEGGKMDEEYEDDKGSQQKQKQPNKLSQVYGTKLIEDEDDEEQEIEDEEEINQEEMQERLKRLKDRILDPAEDDQFYNKEEDIVIKQNDLPERLQLRFKGRELPSEEELSLETRWIFEKFKNYIKNMKVFDKENKNPKTVIQGNAEGQYMRRIKTVLSFLREKGFEVMYIYYYKKNEFRPELDLDDLWKIYDWDNEWSQFYNLKIYLENQIKKIDSIEQNVKAKISTNFRIVTMLDVAKEISTLDHIRDYVHFQQTKYQDFDMQHKFQNVKSTFIKDFIERGYHSVADKVVISADSLADNLHKQSSKYFPQSIPLNKTPEQVAQEIIEALEKQNVKLPYMSHTLKVLQSICRYIANELFYQPLLRQYVLDKYQDAILISTEPTQEGQKEIDILHYLYPVKRIRKRKIDKFNDDLWLHVIQAEKLGLIKIQMYFDWDQEPSKVQGQPSFPENSKDVIYEKLLDNYIVLNPENVHIVNQWNILRSEAIQIYLSEYMYPFCEKFVKKILQERAEKVVIQKCTKKFKETLMTPPWLATVHDPQSGEEYTQQPANSVMAVVMDQQSQLLTFAIVDKNGEVYQTMQVSNFQSGFTQNKDAKIQQPENPQKKQLEKYLENYKPELIVVAANCIAARRIKRDMLEFKNSLCQWVTFGDDTIPQMLAKKLHDHPSMKDYNPQTRVAISLCRMMQNTMAETLQLWSDQLHKNGCLLIPYNQLQDLIPKEKLRDEYEKVAVEVVNKVGVNINDILYHKHLEMQLQFVCGLGPRKSKHLIEKILQKDDVREDKYILERLDLYYLTYISKTVFVNCAGFLKIDGDCPLDRTRIHVENKTLAQKICSDALEEEEDPKGDNNKVGKYDSIKKIMEKPQILQELDFEEYAKHLYEVKKKENMIYILEFIMAELTNPFQDPRGSYKEMSNEELFYKLTKETPQSFKKYLIVTAKIEKVLQDKIIVNIMDNNLKGTIQRNELVCFDDNQKQIETRYIKLQDKFQENEIIKGTVIKIEALETDNKEKKDKKEEDILKVELSMKQVDWLKELKYIVHNFDKDTFHISETNDFPIIQINNMVRKNNKQYHARKINHPKYKHMSLAASIEYINEQPRGDFVIRPSSRGVEFLTITWKFYEDCIVHLTIREDAKIPNMAPKLIMNNETYSSLDEIIERYIQICNGLMEPVALHKKFLQMSQEQIEARLKDDKREQPQVIHYYFGCFNQFPQHIVLLYIPKEDSIVKEYIKVKNMGFYFHDQYFTSLKEIITFFKKEYPTDEYRRYARKRKAPIIMDDKTSKAFNNFSVKNEFVNIKTEQIKREGKKEYVNQGLIICTNCEQPGHTANQCNKSSRSNSNWKENNRSMRNINCHHCGDEGHYPSDCPKGRRSRSRSRSRERRGTQKKSSLRSDRN